MDNLPSHHRQINCRQVAAKNTIPSTSARPCSTPARSLSRAKDSFISKPVDIAVNSAANAIKQILDPSLEQLPGVSISIDRRFTLSGELTLTTFSQSCSTSRILRFDHALITLNVADEMARTASSVSLTNQSALPLQVTHLFTSNNQQLNTTNTFTLPCLPPNTPGAAQIDIPNNTPCNRPKKGTHAPVVEHEPPIMPSRSPGSRPRKLKSEHIDLTKSQEIPESDQEGQVPPQTNAVEIEDGIEVSDDESEIVQARSVRKRRPSAKRREEISRHITPNSETVKGFSSLSGETRGAERHSILLKTDNLDDRTSTELANDAITLTDFAELDKSGRKRKRHTEEAEAHSENATSSQVQVVIASPETRPERTGNARAQKWASLGVDYYKSIKRTSDIESFSAQPKTKILMRKYSSYGPKPRNTLLSSASQKGPFNITAAEFNGETFKQSSSSQARKNPPKRQRTDDRADASNTYPTEIIDLEDNKPTRAFRERSTTRSLKSEGSGGLRQRSKPPTGVSEFQKVENRVNPAPSRSQAKHNNKKHGLLLNGLEQLLAGSHKDKEFASYTKHDSNSDLSIYEDNSDPISDVGGAEKSRGFYSAPPRSTATGKMPTSNRQNFSKTGLKSHHFPSYAKSQTYDAASTSPDELAAPAFVQTAAKRRRTDGKSGESIEELESQRSITDEQLDLQHKATADELLAKADPAEPAAITSDTDDEADKRRIDIQPSEFLPSKKSRSTGQTNNNSCIVKQVFPVQGNSLLAPSKERWLLEYDVGDTQRKKNALKFRDSDGKEVLLVDLSKILKIEYGQDSAKTIIFTSANQDTSSGTRASGTRIHIELESADASTDLRSRLKKVEPTINLISKGLAQDGENYLDRVFQRPNNHRLMPVPTKPSKLEADDLQLIESNSHARNEQKWKEKQKAREGGQTRSSTLRNEATDTPQVAKSKGLARNMQVDQEPIHTMIQSTKSKPVEPQAFYGNGFSQRSLRSAAEPDMVPTRSSLRVPGRNAAPRVRAETPPPPPAWTEVHPEWHKDWNGTVYYPPGGRKGQVTVERDDILRLNEGEFLNDNLVTFYLRYLEHELQQTKPEVANRIYFQNSYFYPTLTKGVKKGINYQAVQRWTRTVDIFAKDYIIVPVCENLHWYVAIICNASKLLESKGPEEDVDAAEQDRKDAQAPAGPFEPSLSTDRGNTNGDGSVKETNDSPASVPDDADLRENKVESLSAQASSQEKPVRMPDTDCDLGKSKLSVAHPKDENKETTLSSSDGISDLPILHRGDEAVTNASDVDCIVPVEDHPIANVKSDILPRSPPKKAASNRKAKRISRLPLRDPAKPRIIILDSLGLPHSATCTNLKQYLVAEIKDKKGKNVEPPKEIGMLARNISLQDNHSDCGLYLLAYITKFLEAPDDFVSGVYQKRTDLVWQPKASEMRNDVRSLLLNLQKNIVTPKSGKSRSKRTEKAAKERQGSLKTQDYAQQLPSKTETSKAEQDHVATPLTKSLSPKPEVHTYATKQTFTESKGGRSPELGPSSSGHREEDEIHRDAGISESCPMEIDDSPENKRFTDASQQGRRSPAREALAPSPKSQSSSSQNSAESSSTLPQRQTEDVVEGDNSVHQSAASMLPDPPSTPGLRYPLVGDGRRSDSHTPGLSMSVIMDEPLPRVEGGADALCADSSPQSIDEPDCGDDLDTSRSQIVQPSAENHEPLPSDDDSESITNRLTQACINGAQSSPAPNPKTSMPGNFSDGEDFMLLASDPQEYVSLGSNDH